MKPIQEIFIEFNKGTFEFHNAAQATLFRDALVLYGNNHYAASASICAVLYEMIFTTRLIRETANPEDFIPSRDNLNEQLHNLMNRENQITNDEKYPFKKITKELLELGVITPAEKSEYDDFYNSMRTPIVHGLLLRLYEPMCGKRPNNIFEVDVNSDPIYSKATEIMVNKIYEIMAIRKLLKT